MEGAAEPHWCWGTLGSQVVKIVVLGKSGQVATSLQSVQNDAIEVIALGRGELDLTNTADLFQPIAAHEPDAIINASAYTAVDQAETNQDAAFVLNKTAVKRLGEVASQLSIPIIHLSTDYVFNGSGIDAWTPDDLTDPLGTYGKSKLAGEMALAEVSSNYAILRTSWVFSATGSNFVKTMLRLGKDRDSLNVVSDQIGGPTSADDIAAASIQIAKALIANPDQKGIWHFSGLDDCNWADFATEIFRQAKIDCDVHAIPSSEYPTPAMRPLNSRLDCTTTEQDFGIKRPLWTDSLTAVLRDLGEVS
ncbi:dTDP-4-dehydrorhamnose reductase [Cognatiyoonia sediminum]|uniref:dTDP-4-dehydrorhamnose reductase n=1 Tax=Cognatiyoonia sediminum TaxID=1508389 RepID=A0A1M5QX87_9RHOB|nr:dTDP-4-dehydrorhamnose reductase [Cognatiyoonia sediminum]